MAKEKKKNSIKSEYDKIRIIGWATPFGRNPSPLVSISLRELGYDLHAADVNFSVGEAKEIIKLIEQAIKEANKEANKKEKN